MTSSWLWPFKLVGSFQTGAERQEGRKRKGAGGGRGRMSTLTCEIKGGGGGWGRRSRPPSRSGRPARVREISKADGKTSHRIRLLDNSRRKKKKKKVEGIKNVDWKLCGAKRAEKMGTKRRSVVCLESSGSAASLGAAGNKSSRASTGRSLYSHLWQAGACSEGKIWVFINSFHVFVFFIYFTKGVLKWFVWSTTRRAV